MEIKRKTVFISYTWDSPEHEEWVLKLANDLIATYGLNVILDQHELSPGKDLPHFMENSIEKADKVLIILTPKYKIKAENRTGGAGYETSMISQEIFESPITNIKFIPILRNGNKEISSPKFLSSKVYHSMIDDKKYDIQLFTLAKSIYNKQLINKPDFGPIPDFSTITLDPIISIANNLAKEAQINKDIDNILSSYDGIKLLENEIEELKGIIQKKINLYESSTNLKFFFLINNHKFIINSSGYSVKLNFSDLYSNSAQFVKMTISFWEGYLQMNSSFYFPDEGPKKIKETQYSFDLTYKKEPIWKSKTETMTNEEITSLIFTFFIEKIQMEKSKKFRGN
jgi:hypothetical protein